MVEDRSIGCVTRQSKHFVARSEGDGKKKKVQCLFLFCLFFSFLFLQSKIKSEISRQAQNSCQEKGDRKLKLRELRDKLNTKKQQQGVKTNLFQHLLFSICFAFPYMYDWLNLPTILLSGKYIYICKGKQLILAYAKYFFYYLKPVWPHLLYVYQR